MDHHYREKGAKNIYSNYNQMRAYVECSPDQSKKLYLIDLSIEQSTKLLRFWKSAGCFCILNFTKVLEFSSTSPHFKMVITAVCVQIDNCFCNM